MLYNDRHVSATHWTLSPYSEFQSVSYNGTASWIKKLGFDWEEVG